jgi:hypothetical protein
VSRAIIFTDQHAPDGRTIRFNVDEGTRAAAARVKEAFEGGDMLEIPNEVEGEEPIFVNPERVATVSPQKEDVT